MSAGHIALVTETYPPEINGVALTIARLASGLRARGHTVSLVRPRRRGDTADAQTTFTAGLPLPGYRAVRCGLPAGGALRGRGGSAVPTSSTWQRRGPSASRRCAPRTRSGSPWSAAFTPISIGTSSTTAPAGCGAPSWRTCGGSGRGSQIRLDDILHRRVDAVADRAFHRSLRPPAEAEGQRHGGDVGGEAEAGSHRAAVDGGRVEDPAGLGVDDAHVDRNAGLLEADHGERAGRALGLERGDGAADQQLGALDLADRGGSLLLHATGAAEVLLGHHVLDVLALEDDEAVGVDERVREHVRHAAADRPGLLNLHVERHDDDALLRTVHGLVLRPIDRRAGVAAGDAGGATRCKDDDRHETGERGAGHGAPPLERRQSGHRRRASVRDALRHPLF